MSKSNSWENKVLLLLFNNTDASGIGDVVGLRGSTTDGDLYVSLHTGDPGEGGSQTTNETNYTSYARVAVPRDSSGWTVTGNSVSPTDNIIFPTGTGGSGTVTHWGIGTELSGAGILLYSGTVTPSISVGNSITPSISSSSTVTED